MSAALSYAEGPLTKSRFLHISKRDDAVCLFHSLTFDKVYGGSLLEALYQAVSAPTAPSKLLDTLSGSYDRDLISRVISELSQKGMLVENTDIDAAKYLQLFQTGLAFNKICHTYFMPVAECNFKCRYCFVENGERALPSVMMSRQLAEQSLEVFAKLSAEAPNVSLTFYGGEPLLNASVVMHAMRYVRALEKEGDFNKRVKMSMVTNGSLIDDAFIDAVLETHTGVSVSIDGPREIHDASRVNTSGHETFDWAIAGYRKLQKAGAKPGVSCTLNKFNATRMNEVLQFIIEELKPQGMGFNVLIPSAGDGNPLDLPYAFVADQLIVAFKVLRERGIYEDRVMRRVRPFVDSRFHFKDCMGVGGQITITPDGKIGPCQVLLGVPEYFPLQVSDLHARLDSLDSTCIYENPLFQEWLHRFPLNIQECSECFAIGVCGGGCPYAALTTRGSIWALDDRVCCQAKQIMTWMLWDTYDHFVADDSVPGDNPGENSSKTISGGQS